jgi:hypothetical protein
MYYYIHVFFLHHLQSIHSYSLVLSSSDTRGPSLLASQNPHAFSKEYALFPKHVAGSSMPLAICPLFSCQGFVEYLCLVILVLGH